MLMARGELTSSSTLKGRPPLRQVPDDFDIIFVEQGRDGCEGWYRARKTTVTRWLEERGKVRLIRLRAEYVAHQRANGNWITRSTRLVEHREIGRPSARKAVRDRRKVPVLVARHAAQHLRIMKAKAAEKVIVTVADIAQQLDEDREFARELENPSAAFRHRWARPRCSACSRTSRRSTSRRRAGRSASVTSTGRGQ
jgi:hypothetical protein